ncbi:MAG TPA: acetaldehyde dehydrogenase, partial [Solibacterales bacterium]|nr:acetaldehyde dehydrogenase [Bryobacterales bacterium]
VILSTGGSGIVRAAYSSGKPAFGVGPGNVPVLVDESCDMTKTIRK